MVLNEGRVFCVIEEVKRSMTQTMERRYIGARELAAYIDSTEGSVRQLARQRRIPHVRRGRRVLFDRIVIDKWLAAQAVEAG